MTSPMRDRPRVEAAGLVSALPLSQMFAWGPIVVEGRTRAPGEAFINADMRFVDGDYFRAMRIPLVEGRLFVDGDRRPGPRVALVDARMAAQLWPGGSPIGRRVQLGADDDPDAPWITIVGVVGGVKRSTLDADSRIAMYLPHAQFPVRAMNVVIRSGNDPAALTAAARQALRAVDPELPIVALARRSGIKLHLDGARLFLQAAYTGEDVAVTARPFDTVYVSLYKYFNAASGAILAGPRALLDGMHHTRRMFGGGLSSVWPFAAIARHYAKGFGDRYQTAVQVSEELIRILPQRGAFAVGRVPSGTNLFRLRAPAADPAAFQKRLAARQIMLPPPQGDVFLIGVNETLNRTNASDLADALGRALNASDLADALGRACKADTAHRLKMIAGTRIPGFDPASSMPKHRAAWLKPSSRPNEPKVSDGRDDWIRTSDPLTPSQVRYQAAPRPDAV